MSTEEILALLIVNQLDNGLWLATVPEMTAMWKEGVTRQEAINSFLRAYDVPVFHPYLNSFYQKRVAESNLGPTTIEEVRE